MQASKFIQMLDDSRAYCSCCGNSLPKLATNQTDTEYLLCEDCESEALAENPPLKIFTHWSASYEN